MNAVEEYGIPFLIGGILFAGTKFAAIKYTSHHMTQKYAALVASLPLGLLSTLFVIEANKTDAYIRNYTVQTLVTVAAGLAYLIGSHTYYNWSKKIKIEILPLNECELLTLFLLLYGLFSLS